MILTVRLLEDAISPVEESYDCYYGRNTYQWQPAQISTYVMTIFEIELLMVQLNGILADLQIDTGDDYSEKNSANAKKI